MARKKVFRTHARSKAKLDTTTKQTRLTPEEERPQWWTTREVRDLTTGTGKVNAPWAITELYDKKKKTWIPAIAQKRLRSPKTKDFAPIEPSPVLLARRKSMTETVWIVKPLTRVRMDKKLGMPIYGVPHTRTVYKDATGKFTTKRKAKTSYIVIPPKPIRVGLSSAKSNSVGAPTFDRIQYEKPEELHIKITKKSVKLFGKDLHIKRITKKSRAKLLKKRRENYDITVSKGLKQREWKFKSFKRRVYKDEKGRVKKREDMSQFVARARRAKANIQAYSVVRVVYKDTPANRRQGIVGQMEDLEGVSSYAQVEGDRYDYTAQRDVAEKQSIDMALDKVKGSFVIIKKMTTVRHYA
jgi:hypothetical protein